VLCFVDLFSAYVLLAAKSVLDPHSALVPSYAPTNLAKGALSIVLFVLMLGIAIAFYLRKHERAFELVTVLLVLSLFYWLYFHSSSQGTYQFVDYRQGSYYDELARELRSGALGVTIEGNRAIADWSFYKGVNYLYFAPFPAIFQILIASIFGISTTFDELTLVLSITNLAALFILMRDIAKYFRLNGNRTLWLRMIFFLVYGFGPLYFLASRYFAYETAIIFGSTFLILSTIVFLRYYNMSRRFATEVTLLAISSLLLSISFLSRYNLALCFIPLAILVLLKETNSRKNHRNWISKALVLLLVFALPMMTIGFASASYNNARFGSPFEFGVTYQHLGSPDEAERLAQNQSTSVLYLPRNLYHLFLLVPKLSFTRPYVEYIAPAWLVGKFPRLANAEWPGSIFFTSPLLLFLFASVMYFRKSSYHGTLVALILLAFSSAVYPLFYMGYSRRYLQDFYPFLTLLAFLGFSYFWTASRRRLRSLRLPIIIILTSALIWSFFASEAIVIQFGFQSDLARALRIYNDPSTFVYLM
jgi:hypothetical protein